jgi:hypothetical protein
MNLINLKNRYEKYIKNYNCFLYLYILINKTKKIIYISLNYFH